MRWSKLTPSQRDRLVAEKVMNWKQGIEIFPYTQQMGLAWFVLLKIVDDYKAVGPRNPSPELTRFADALLRYSDSWSGDEIYPAIDIFAIVQDWTPERICIAALKAVGVEIEEE